MGSIHPPAKKPKLSLASLQSSFIKVLLGEDEVDFYVNRHDVCIESEFFKSACKDCWSSGQEGVVRLTEDDPKIFSIFATWLITKDIEQAEDLIEVSSKKEPDHTCEFEDQYVQLSECLFLASMLQAENFQNAVMDHMLLRSSACDEECNKLLGGALHHAELVYTNTIHSSPLRRYLTDMMVAGNLQNIAEFLPRSSEQWAYEYAFEMMKSAIDIAHDMTIKRPLEYPWEKDRCTYHEHRGQPEGYNCAKSKDGKKVKGNSKRKR